jgi:hypothetical protein
MRTFPASLRAQMSRVNHVWRKALNRRPVFAGVLLGLFVSVMALAHFEALHLALHPDACESDHHCAVTVFQAGQVDAPVTYVAVVTPAADLTAPATMLLVAPPAMAVVLLPGRAPPVTLL